MAGFIRICKTGVVPTLVLIVRDSVLTLSAIAYNVKNNLDIVLLAIVCTVEYRNMFNRGRFLLKLNYYHKLADSQMG